MEKLWRNYSKICLFKKKCPCFVEIDPLPPKCWCITKIENNHLDCLECQICWLSRNSFISGLHHRNCKRLLGFFRGALPHYQLILYPQFLLPHKPSWPAHFVIQSSRMFMNAWGSWEMLSRFRDISCLLSCSSLSIWSINDWWWTFIENLRGPSSTYHQPFCNDTSCMHVLCHISPRPTNFNKTETLRVFLSATKKSAPPKFSQIPRKKRPFKKEMHHSNHPFSGDFPSVFLPLRLHTSCMVPVMAASLMMQVVSLPNWRTRRWMNETSITNHRKQVRFGSDDLLQFKLQDVWELQRTCRKEGVVKDEHQIQSMKHWLKV